MIREHRRTQAGFTLIEVIIMIIMGAMLAAVLIQFTGTNLIHSAATVQSVRDDVSAINAMEQITQAYQAWLAGGATNLTDFRTQILATYAGVVVPGETVMVTLQPSDAANSILQVTVAAGDFELSTLFTR